jgi:predicted metal-dependent hydrolase
VIPSDTTLEIQGTAIPFRVVKTRGRSISLRFSVREPLLEIRTPSGQFRRAERLAISQHEAWILKHYTLKQKSWQRREAFIEGLERGQALYLGQPVQVEVVAGERAEVSIDEEAKVLRLVLSPAFDSQPLPMSLYQGLRSLAKQELKHRALVQAYRTGLNINQVRVKDVTTRWGSCSEKRNINLNWHLILLKPELIDYLLIHELMHLHEMNHSPRFWAWVSKYCPDYERAERELTEAEWLIGVFDQWIKAG